MDPFTNVDIALHSLILQHLSGSDLIKLSEVSTNHCDIITKRSEEGEEKVVLFVDENWTREFDPDLIEIRRSYNSIRVHQLFRTRENVFKMIRRFDQFLTCIDTTFDFNMHGLKLPKVKSLSLHPYPRFFEFGLLSSVSNLKKLHISGKSRHPERIYDCLSASPGLQELTLENGAADQTFSFDIDEFGIKLKVFKTNDTNFEDHIETHFVMFMTTQRDSIQEIKLLKCDFSLLVKILGETPTIKRVTFSPTIHPFAWQPFKAYPNIEEMNLIHIAEQQLPILIARVPNLKKLYIADPTVNMFRQLLFRAPALREFRYAHFPRETVNNHDLKTYYLQHRAANYPNINRNIEIISQI